MMTTNLANRSARLADAYRHTPTSELLAELAWREAGTSRQARRIAEEIRGVLDHRMAKSAFAL